MRQGNALRFSAAGLTLLVACGAPAPEVQGDRVPLEITYLANAGYLLSAGEDKILIDGLFRAGIEGYATVPEEWRDSVETGAAPFDLVDLVLATHEHGDHFDAGAVCRFLDTNPLAEFVSTRQSLDRMRSGCDDPAALEGRVRAALTENRISVPVRVGDLFVEPIFLHHGPANPVDNAGFLIEIGGWTVLHTGDTEATVGEMRAAGLGERTIDLAFVPYWYLLDKDWIPVVKDVLKPAAIVAMHIPAHGSAQLESFGGWDTLLATIRSRFPSAIAFAQPFDSRTFRESATGRVP